MLHWLRGHNNVLLENLLDELGIRLFCEEVLRVYQLVEDQSVFQMLNLLQPSFRLVVLDWLRFPVDVAWDLAGLRVQFFRLGIHDQVLGLKEGVHRYADRIIDQLWHDSC